MFFACSRDSRSTEAYLVAEIITLIYLTVTRTVPAASLKQLLERNFAENYDGWWRGGEELSNFPLKFDPEKERKKEEEKKMVTLSSLMRPFRTIYIYVYVSVYQVG